MLAKMKILAKTLAINENSRGKWTWWREIHIAKFQTDESSQEEETKIQCRNKPSPPSRNRKKRQEPNNRWRLRDPAEKEKGQAIRKQDYWKGGTSEGTACLYAGTGRSARIPTANGAIEKSGSGEETNCSSRWETFGSANSQTADREKKLTVHPDGKPLDRQIAKPKMQQSKAQ